MKRTRFRPVSAITRDEFSRSHREAVLEMEDGGSVSLADTVGRRADGTSDESL
jgi:hypothetical protein